MSTTAKLDPQVALAELQERKPDRVTIVVLSGSMDRVMSAFIIATGAASMGMQVTMFFTFWGLNVIRKPGLSSKARDWLRRAFGLLNRGGADTLPLSRFHFWGLGTRMMKLVMRRNRMPGVPELMDMAKDLGVNLYPCQMTMDLYGLTKDDFIEGLETPLGAASFIDMAADSDITLFI